jgi:hypothetical protein
MAGLTPWLFAATGRERVEAGDAAIMVPAVRERAWVKAAGRVEAGGAAIMVPAVRERAGIKAAGRVVVFKAEPGVRKTKVGDADSR